MDKKQEATIRCYIGWQGILYINYALKVIWAMRYVDWKYTTKGVESFKQHIAKVMLEALDGKPSRPMLEYEYNLHLEDFIILTDLLEGKFINKDSRAKLIERFKRESDKLEKIFRKEMGSI